MKKLMALLLTLVMCLSLCACSSGGATATESTTPATEPTIDLTEELTFGLWKKTLMNRATLLFNEDGTGTIGYRNGSSAKMQWRLQDTSLTVINENNAEYLFTIDSSKEYLRILDEEGFAYVKEANYTAERDAAMEKYAAEATEIDWETVFNEYFENEVRAKAKYAGQPIKFTAGVFNVSSYGFDVFRKTSKVSGYMSVGMDSDLLAQLDSHGNYTFIGFLQGGYSDLNIACTFVAE